jgi:cell wall-associated NlpC family hydrolase
MNRSFGICNLSVVPVRAEASDKSEMLTQLLFGDHFEIKEIREKWVQIKAAYDDYEGWIDRKQFAGISAEIYQKLDDQYYIAAPLHNQSLKMISGEIINLVPGSSLPFFQKNQVGINNESYEFSGVAVDPHTNVFSEVGAAAKFYLHTPYLWGGKSTFGIDCSGLTQMVLKQFAIKIKRDTWQQAEQGEMVESLNEAKTGDLAFFDNDEGRIVHVGILLDGKIIHASGRVKIESIDNQGIYSDELGRYTHKLKVIKRYHR